MDNHSNEPFGSAPCALPSPEPHRKDRLSMLLLWTQLMLRHPLFVANPGKMRYNALKTRRSDL